MELYFELNNAQYMELEGLAYHIADLRYTQERFSRAEHYESDLKSIQQTISFAFEQLDKLQVPFWVQNHVIIWAEEWRNLLRADFAEALKAHNIIINKHILQQLTEEDIDT